MTTQEILKKVIEMKVEDNGIYNVVARDKYNALVEALKQEIRDENNKATGRTNPARLAKAIFKTGKASLMKYAYTEDGIKWVLDGYRIAGFFDDVDLPEVPEDQRDRWYKVEHIVDNEYDDTEMTAPTIGELKAEIKLAKAEKKRCMYVFDNGICVNAQYLLDFMEGLDNIRIYAYTYTNGKVTMKSPIRIEADNGIGVLLPINHNFETSGFYYG